MIRRLKRAWCRAFHRAVMFAGGPTYTCRRCGECWENPALDGPMQPHPTRKESDVTTTDGLLV